MPWLFCRCDVADVTVVSDVVDVTGVADVAGVAAVRPIVWEAELRALADGAVSLIITDVVDIFSCRGVVVSTVIN